MHRLLMERGDIIYRLIAVKQSQETGSAFRPAREADMMRRLVERHRGILPLDTVESISRVIISTFTYVQSTYAVHADVSAGEAAMRDFARFHFGFTAPFVPHIGAAGVVEAVSASKGDLGLVPAFAGAGAWWTLLEAKTRRRSSRGCRLSNAPTIPPPFRSSRCRAPRRRCGRDRGRGLEPARLRLEPRAAAAVDALAEASPCPTAPSTARRAGSLPSGIRWTRVTDALVKAGASVRSSTLVGSHATRYRVPDDGDRPVPSGR